MDLAKVLRVAGKADLPGTLSAGCTIRREDVDAFRAAELCLTAQAMATRIE